MKLRNKKTGKRGLIGNCTNDFIVVYPVNEKWEAYDDEKYVYFTISDFCEDWEDDEPAEPLIKDEKVRKAVRAWAETNSIDKIIIFDYINDSPYVSAGEVKFAEFGGHSDIRLRTDEKFDTDKIYTVTELCGEEEE